RRGEPGAGRTHHLSADSRQRGCARRTRAKLRQARAAAFARRRAASAETEFPERQIRDRRDRQAVVEILVTFYACSPEPGFLCASRIQAHFGTRIRANRP